MLSKRPDQNVPATEFELLAARLLMSAVTESDGMLETPLTAPALSGVAPVAEAESVGGMTNDEMSDAEELVFERMLPDLPHADGYWPQQAVVDGVADGAGGVDYSRSMTLMASLSNGRVLNLNFRNATPPGTDGVLTLRALGDLGGEAKYLTVTAEGIDLGTVFVEDGVTGSTVEAQIALSREKLAILAEDGTVTVTVTCSEAMLARSGGITGVVTYGGGGAGTSDYYAMALSAGESVSLAVAGGEDVELELLDSDGQVLATGGGDYSNVTAAIANFSVQEAGTFYLRVAGTGEYRLVANRNAAMDLETNDSLASAQVLDSAQLDGRQWAAGQFDVGADTDCYSLTATAGSLLKVRAYTQVENQAQPVVAIYDSAGRLVANGEDLQTTYRVPRGGDGVYTIVVTSADTSGGEYVLSVQNRPFRPGAKTRGRRKRLWYWSESDRCFVQPKGPKKVSMRSQRGRGVRR